MLGVVKSKHTPLMKDGCHIIGRVKREYNDKLRLEVESCKARDKYNFRNYILDQEKIPTLLEKLHKLIDGKKGKDVAVVLQCAIELRLIDKPSYLDVLQEFPKIGAKSGYYTYIDYEYFAEKTKESIKDELREV